VGAFNDIANAKEHSDVRAKFLKRTLRVAAGCAGNLPKDELVKLQERLKTFETSVAARV
jgi:hypothetical protein